MFVVDELGCIPLFLILEYRPDTIEARHAARLHTPLPRPAAEEIGALIANDLQRLVPAVAQFGLALIGHSYPLTQLLQPGLPMQQLLLGQYRLGQPGPFRGQLLFIGAQNGRLPDARMETAAEAESGALRALPIALVGPPESLATVSATLEEILVQRGLPSPPLLSALHTWYDVPIAHGCYMTQLDVLALLRAQHEQIGLGLLSDLLEQAHLEPQQARSYAGVDARWVWTGADARGLVSAPFAPEDAVWRQAAIEHRRVLLGLQAYGIPAGLDLQFDGARRPAADWRLLPLRNEGLLADWSGPASALQAIEDPELGLLAFRGLDAKGQTLGHALPLDPAACRLSAADRSGTSRRD